ncbi:MAG: YHYH protein [Deltaproteobacteria bacterium]|nr:YHYH protein [Deltaproteobacteria bacterium]
MKTNRFFALLVCGATLGACAPMLNAMDGGDGGSAEAGAGDAAVGDASTGTALNEGYRRATWGSGVTVTYGDCTIRFQSNGIPNHARDVEYALPNTGVRVPTAATSHPATDPTVAQSYDVTLNTCPVVQATTTATSLGNIAYMISGASLFNGYEGDGTTVALANNFSVTGTMGQQAFFVDACNGHPTPMGQYHYHGLPTCVTAAVDMANGPSHILGIAADGFPVYGNRDIHGAEVTLAQLDECNGITSATPEFPAGVYHYVLPATTTAASAMRCYRGRVATTGAGMAMGMGMGMGMMPPGGGPPPGGLAPPELNPCGNTDPLSVRDPSPGSRVLSGVVQSFRESLSGL